MTDWTDEAPFRIAQRTADGLMFLSGWSQHRLQPTFNGHEDHGLIWINEARFDRWRAKHPSNEWDEIELIRVPLEPRRDRGGDRFRRSNRNPNRRLK